MLAHGALFSLLVFAQYVFGEPSIELKYVADQWPLPEYLKEASGIAVINDQSILLHDDEVAVIYHISLADRSVEVFGWLGSPEFEQDFEGIALDGEMLYLVTSKGLIYRAEVNLSERSQALDFVVFDTGLDSICELEGLYFLAGKLLLPCKEPRESLYKNKLVVFEFDVASRVTREHFVLSSRDFGILEGPYPTAIEVFEGHYYVISTNHLLKIDLVTLSTSVFSLAKLDHFQPEGIGILKDGLIVVVEDVRKGESKLTHYSGLEMLAQTR